MYLRKDKRKNGRIYLSIGENYRVDGKTKTRHLESVGYVDELVSDGCPDPIAFWQAEVARRNAEAARPSSKVIVKLSTGKRIDKRAEGRVEMGAAVPSAYFHRDLGIADFFERRRTARKSAYDPCRILELLCWNRIADPGSKASAFAARGRFPRKCGFTLGDVYRSLDYLAANAGKLVGHMNASLEGARGPRDRTRLYYDVTNYYFEIDGEDEGEGGLRKRGVSKEHRPEAIVQMGLLIDAAGIPLDYELFPGNVNDMSTMLPMMKKAGLRDAENPDGERVVVVADKGLNTSNNIAACTLDGNGFVFSQSVRKATRKLKEWVLDEAGYEVSESGRFKVKSRIADKAVYITGEDGKRRKVMVPVKEVAFWSRDFFDRSRHERAKVIEKSKAAIASREASSAAAKTSIKYAKDVPVVKATGEKAQHNWVLDEKKIEEDAKMDGYYCIITSEQEWTEREIIEAYRGLSRIEESFRVLKSTMDARPVYVWTTPHIEAHFLVCYVALLQMRLMQADVEAATGTRPSAEAVSEALRNMVGHRLDTNVYHFDYRTDLTDALCSCVGIDLSREVMTKSQMNKVMSVVKKPRS